jgi:hypothetical protein
MKKNKDDISGKSHPSRDLAVRQEGFGIAAGYEKPYSNQGKPTQLIDSNQLYGAVPHSGYYGTGIGLRPFKRGQAGFNEEMSWYEKQYGEATGKKSKVKK